ncbi:MAG: hypothetical protein FWG64_07630 [Firmicutes bacterium]|nr:hypothetical protein [Bacillota bacterium]
MDIKKIIKAATKNAPCDSCGYKLGLVQTLVSPCPQCRKSNYSSYDMFKVPTMPKNYKNL